MSGSGAPELSASGSGLRVAVIATSWHAEVMAGLIHGAEKALQEADCQKYEIIRIPGAFELPLAALRAANQAVDAIVALGVVIRGGTPHFDYVCNAATDGLTRVQLDTGIPIGFGLLTVDDEQQALERSQKNGDNKGVEAVQAALSMVTR